MTNSPNRRRSHIITTAGAVFSKCLRLVVVIYAICICSIFLPTTVYSFMSPTRVVSDSIPRSTLRTSTRVITTATTSSCLTFAHLTTNNDDDGTIINNKHEPTDGTNGKIPSVSLVPVGRREWFQQVATMSSALALGTTFTLSSPLLAYAGGLLQFPIGPETQPLKNQYHFMRAGTSELEMDGIYSTNPLFLTNRENEMSSEGEAQIMKAIEVLRTTEMSPTICYHSLAANGMDTGDLIARKLRLGREKMLPEFTYLDQRGVGLWDSSDESVVKPAIWALDYLEGGKEGKTGRPPPNEDGTPNETLGDQFIRLRQFLSLQESRTSGEIILVIFPDGTGPALLSCMIAGIPYNQVHALEYAPGELRLDITPESVKALYQQRKDDPNYLSILEDGKIKLQELRNKKSNNFVGLKELKEDKERLEMEAAYDRKVQADRQREIERQQQLAKEKELQLIAKEEERARRKAQLAAAEEANARKKAERQAAAAEAAAAKKRKAAAAAESSSVSGTSNGGGAASGLDFGSIPIIAAAALGVAGLGLLASGSPSSDDTTDSTKSDIKKESVINNVATPTKTTTTKVNPNVTNVELTIETKSSPPKEDDSPTITAPAASTLAPSDKKEENQISVPTAPSQQPPKVSTLYGNQESSVISNETEEENEKVETDAVDGDGYGDDDVVSAADQKVVDGDDGDDGDDDEMIQGHLDRLAAEEQAMKDALEEIALTHKKNQQSQRQQQQEKQQKQKKLQNPASSNANIDTATTMDDGFTDDWLKVMAEIRDEEEDDDDDDIEGVDYFNYLKNSTKDDDEEGELMMMGVVNGAGGNNADGNSPDMRNSTKFSI